ncbi:hypothetical protein PIB30_048677 [Stylosanthes scabra]|uniref:Uncharacterized protein n=1 Tax=Stylosanthes scabra TaxID=79078 RepID=A0ABU6QHV0_9FABA|nr:hypothetical protein [Stylosanthes scabra]
MKSYNSKWCHYNGAPNSMFSTIFNPNNVPKCVRLLTANTLTHSQCKFQFVHWRFHHIATDRSCSRTKGGVAEVFDRSRIPINQHQRRQQGAPTVTKKHDARQQHLPCASRLPCSVSMASSSSHLNRRRRLLPRTAVTAEKLYDSNSVHHLRHSLS